MHRLVIRSLEISNFIACNVYWDFGNCPGTERQHKYLFSIAAGEDEFHPRYVRNITVHGPNNLKAEIGNHFFTRKFADGDFYDSSNGNYWYMKNVRSGFLTPGEYTVEITLKNGAVSSISRIQDDGPCGELLRPYLENKQSLEYYPVGELESPTELSRIECRWSSLKEVSGVDAYYIFRLSAIEAWWTFIQDLVFRNNDFFEERGNLNRSSMLIKKTLQADTVYAWWVEIRDAPRMEKTNICILQPIHTFTTPKD
jgi:hypothetical protein